MSAPTVEPTADTTTESVPDFEPQCTIHFINPGMVLAGLPPQPCPEAAKWSGLTPCCGVAALVCEHHHVCHLKLACPCGKLCEDLIGWTRL